MDFRKATDELCEGVSHEELAKTLGVSIASIRQARLNESAKARRSPPENWEKAVAQLAEQRVERYRKLVERLRADQ